MIIAYLKKSLSCAWNEIGQNINLRNGQDSHSQLFPPGTEKNMLPTIPSLERICESFGITLSQFFLEDSENTVVITDQQRMLLEYAAKLEPEQYDALLSFLKKL